MDRQDDGVAWHILRAIAAGLGQELPLAPDDCSEFSISTDGQTVDLSYSLQLTPEMAEIFARYDKVCFIDAHTGSVADDVHVELLESHFQKSPLTHHLTPQSCLALSSALYGKSPQSILVSVRGHQFGFLLDLSQQTSDLVPQAAEIILEWIQS
jgi:Ni,Fe-hydrogenase maturation factor